MDGEMEGWILKVGPLRPASGSDSVTRVHGQDVLD